MNFFQQIIANRRNRALKKEAVAWAKSTIAAAESDAQKLLAQLNAQIADKQAQIALNNRKLKEAETRIKNAQAVIAQKLAAIGAPNATALSQNLEQLTAVVRDGVNFVNAQAYARAVEIAAAHGLRPPAHIAGQN